VNNVHIKPWRYHYLRCRLKEEFILFKSVNIPKRTPNSWVNVATRISVSTKKLSYEGVTKSFRTGRLEQELQMVQLSPTRCSCIAILWASLVSFATITLCVASQRMFIVVSVYFVIDTVRKLLDTPSYKGRGDSSISKVNDYRLRALGTSCSMEIGVTWPESKADHSSPYNTEMQNAWTLISLPPMRLHAVILKCRDKM
jgi:hypothetical protein